MSDAPDVVRAFVDAYARGDRARVRALVDDALDAHVTTPDGGVDDTHGAEAFIGRLPDLEGADLTLTVSQAVEVEPGRVLAMVRVEAARKGAVLHNHGAFLVRVAGGQLTELWMVDALPAESAAFWSA